MKWFHNNFITAFWYSIPTLIDIMTFLYLKVGHIRLINIILKIVLILYLSISLLLPIIINNGKWISYILWNIFIIWLIRNACTNQHHRVPKLIHKYMNIYMNFISTYGYTIKFILITTLGIINILIL